jgi:pimeloyl-ACP methyl ester carboxylesterase
MTGGRALLIAATVLATTACGGPPFAVKRNVLGARREATNTVITSGELSRRTHNMLYEHDLAERYKDDPAGALAILHAAFVAGDMRGDNVACLAEIAFDYATHGGGSPYYLASALYAWAYLFPDDPHDVPDRFDPRMRLATELYNRGVTHGLDKVGQVDLDGGTFPLPFGTLDVSVAPDSLVWSGHRLYDFYPLVDIEVTGFPTYYRWPGLGAPLAAKVEPTENDVDLLAPRARVPVTAVLRPQDLRRGLRDGTVRATIATYPGYGDTTIKVDSLQVPLEAEPTAALGLALSETALWEHEISIVRGASSLITKKNRLISTRPYRPGLIPVVFVHGTGSSPIRWAELYNELDNDPVLHDHYQFWFFSYDSGAPIIYSSYLLREALQHAVAKLDPDGKDRALQRMVIMGHSQGGLLTKMTVVESGDAFWRNISKKPFDDVKMSPDTRELLRKVLFVHPLPFVERVVFVSTPHGGSYVAGSWIAHQAARLITAPLQVTKVVGDVLTLNREDLALQGLRGAPSAVDNMTPGNSFVKTLAALPIAPGVVANSIIPVDGGPPAHGKNDTVVEYDSAHIEGVESELIVWHAIHSCQSRPETMAEVKRILMKHLTME